jgi:hypothetical protein
MQGDFRTQFEKDKAINIVRAELGPFHIELRGLTGELEKVKTDLAEPRKAQPDAAPEQKE